MLRTIKYFFTGNTLGGLLSWWVRWILGFYIVHGLTLNFFYLVVDILGGNAVMSQGLYSNNFWDIVLTSYRELSYPIFELLLQGHWTVQMTIYGLFYLSLFIIYMFEARSFYGINGILICAYVIFVLAQYGRDPHFAYNPSIMADVLVIPFWIILYWTVVYKILRCHNYKQRAIHLWVRNIYSKYPI